jgi:hypothetical protein
LPSVILVFNRVAAQENRNPVLVGERSGEDRLGASDLASQTESDQMRFLIGIVGGIAPLEYSAAERNDCEKQQTNSHCADCEDYDTTTHAN